MDEAELARQMEKAELENTEIGGKLVDYFLINALDSLIFFKLGDDDQSDMEAEGANEAAGSGEEAGEEGEAEDEE